MAYLKKWTAVAVAGAALSLVGVMSVGPGLAGAQSNGALRQSTSTVSPDAVPIVPGTYLWFVNGANAGSVTLASNNTFTSTVFGTNDSGTWAQNNKTAALTITAGSDASGGCIFAGHVNDTGTGISFAGKPGDWACTGYGTKGTFYIEPGPAVATSQAHGAGFTGAGVTPATAGKVVLGKYKWTINGVLAGHITFAKHNLYTSTVDDGDSGPWVQGGSAVAFSITGGNDAGFGCLFVGKGNHTGTAIGTSPKPGSYVCPGFASGTFTTS